MFITVSVLAYRRICYKYYRNKNTVEGHEICKQSLFKKWCQEDFMAAYSGPSHTASFTGQMTVP